MDKIESMLGFEAGEFVEFLLGIGIKLAISIAVIVIGFWLANKLSKTVRKVLTKKETDASLVGFLSSLTSTGLKILVLVTAITQLGVEMTSFIAILALLVLLLVWRSQGHLLILQVEL